MKIITLLLVILLMTQSCKRSPFVCYLCSYTREVDSNNNTVYGPHYKDENKCNTTKQEMRDYAVLKTIRGHNKFKLCN